MRGAFQTCDEYMPENAYRHYVFTPQYTDGPRSKTLMRSEVEAFKKSIEEWTGSMITDEALDHAINVYNTNRRLLRQVYEMRRLENPVVSGTEAMAMVLSSQIMDKEEHNRLLADAIKELRQRTARARRGRPADAAGQRHVRRRAGETHRIPRCNRRDRRAVHRQRLLLERGHPPRQTGSWRSPCAISASPIVP